MASGADSAARGARDAYGGDALTAGSVSLPSAVDGGGCKGTAAMAPPPPRVTAPPQRRGVFRDVRMLNAP